ncbi:hypothetical protein SLH49_01735 [Cognatiyoonia sp. IB215446]|uniref:hypothetical protein n=1 Tax=Cognatiyoonia sp. IB215446 TaxID=3097355 RepID=UPI002A0C24C5|nr:hypothetical protein [Cognatiyoonia sp. IB215446]MDX8346694.1 hypothetical protein [Cognatiyoonia sp. IB215446]
MKRTLFALSAVALVGFAGSASAMSLQFELPRLSFPTQPAPETTQGCADLKSLQGDVCVTPAK